MISNVKSPVNDLPKVPSRRGGYGCRSVREADSLRREPLPTNGSALGLDVRNVLPGYHFSVVRPKCGRLILGETRIAVESESGRGVYCHGNGGRRV